MNEAHSVTHPDLLKQSLEMVSVIFLVSAGVACQWVALAYQAVNPSLWTPST